VPENFLKVFYKSFIVYPMPVVIFRVGNIVCRV
jgi:hypothetical protein